MLLIRSGNRRLAPERYANPRLVSVENPNRDSRSICSKFHSWSRALLRIRPNPIPETLRRAILTESRRNGEANLIFQMS